MGWGCLFWAVTRQWLGNFPGQCWKPQCLLVSSSNAWEFSGLCPGGKSPTFPLYAMAGAARVRELQWAWLLATPGGPMWSFPSGDMPVVTHIIACMPQRGCLLWSLPLGMMLGAPGSSLLEAHSTVTLSYSSGSTLALAIDTPLSNRGLREGCHRLMAEWGACWASQPHHLPPFLQLGAEEIHVMAVWAGCEGVSCRQVPMGLDQICKRGGSWRGGRHCSCESEVGSGGQGRGLEEKSRAERIRAERS